MAAPYPTLAEDLLDVAGVAARIGCGERAARNLMRGMPGLVFRSGNAWVIKAERLEQWIAGDPEVRRIAVIDPRASAVEPEPVRGSHLRTVAGGLR